ncbi:unnamed protein product [Vicia faba]|uniref:Uncharacterized protein n=1 Tax=Vicia faba TaxID=3906 RepID=A0AAV0YKZ4_VICFA|nr:unnamed protein product [Vicia faba]
MTSAFNLHPYPCNSETHISITPTPTLTLHHSPLLHIFNLHQLQASSLNRVDFHYNPIESTALSSSPTTTNLYYQSTCCSFKQELYIIFNLHCNSINAPTDHIIINEIVKPNLRIPSGGVESKKMVEVNRCYEPNKLNRQYEPRTKWRVIEI